MRIPALRHFDFNRASRRFFGYGGEKHEGADDDQHDDNQHNQSRHDVPFEWDRRSGFCRA